MPLQRLTFNIQQSAKREIAFKGETCVEGVVNTVEITFLGGRGHQKGWECRVGGGKGGVCV